jgi:hypothetical protein
VGCPRSSRYRCAQNPEDFGAIELWRARLDYRQETVFNAATYLGFLDQLARCYRRRGAILIQDNASYCVLRGKAITSPKPSRSAVRSDADHDSGLMPISDSMRSRSLLRWSEP